MNGLSANPAAERLEKSRTDPAAMELGAVIELLSIQIIVFFGGRMNPLGALRAIVLYLLKEKSPLIRSVQVRPARATRPEAK